MGSGWWEFIYLGIDLSNALYLLLVMPMTIILLSVCLSISQWLGNSNYLRELKLIGRDLDYSTERKGRSYFL